MEFITVLDGNKVFELGLNPLLDFSNCYEREIFGNKIYTVYFGPNNDNNNDSIWNKYSSDCIIDNWEIK